MLTSNAPRIASAPLTRSTFHVDMPLTSNGLFDWSRFHDGPGLDGALDPLQKVLMLCDPQISAALALRRASILFDDVAFEPCVPYGHSDFKNAVKNTDLCREALNGIDGGLTSTLEQSLQADWWRNTCGDINFEERTIDGKQASVPGVIDVHTTGDYILWRKDGRVVGVQPFANGVAANTEGKANVYDVSKYLVHIFRPSPRCAWDGTDLARVVWEPYYSKQRGQPLELMYLELFSNPSLVGIAPADAVGNVPLLDQYGKPIKDENNQEILVPPQVAMSKGLEGFGGSGAFTVIPPKADLKLMEAQGDGRIFINFEDAKDWQILTGILGTGNMTARAKYGSNASAQTGQEAVEAPARLDAAALESRLQGICKTILEVNVPANRRHFVPKVRLNSSGRSFLETLFITLLANSPYADDRLINGIAERIGAPKPDFDSIKEAAQEKQAQAQQQAQQQQGAQPA